MIVQGHELPKLGKAFEGSEHYRHRTGSTYALLPFRFLKLDARRYIATSFVGEYVVLGADDLHALVRHALDADCELYNQLKAKHFLLDGDSTIAIDLLACKYRTK